MPMSRRSRRFTALLACWAVLWTGFVPLLAHAVSTGRPAGVDALLHASLCSMQSRTPQRSEPRAGEAPPPASAGFAAHTHCPLCASAGDHAAPPPAAPISPSAARAVRVAAGGRDQAVLRDERWPGVSSRGPPRPG